MSGQNPAEMSTIGPKAPIINLPVVVWALVGLILAIHAVLEWGGTGWQTYAVYMFSFIPARLGPAHFPQAPGSAIWSFLTYGLLHGDWGHVLTNSLWLAVFSKPVQARLGTMRFVLLLCLSIIGGAVASLAVHWGEPIMLVGISAGVSGILAAAIPVMYARQDLRHRSRIHPLTPLEILRDRRALTFTLMWMGLTVVTATSQFLTGSALIEERVVAWESHVGGFIVGMIAFYVLDRANQPAAVHTLH